MSLDPGLFSFVLDHLDGGVMIGATQTGPNVEIIFANRALGALLQRAPAELVGSTLTNFDALTGDPGLASRVRNALDQAQPFRGEGVVRQPQGTVVPVELELIPRSDAEGVLTHVIVLVRDLRERLRLEQQLWHSQRLEAVSHLASGVSHDLNNVLLALSGHTAFLLESIPESDPRRVDAAGIEQAARRTASLINHLLALSRRQPAVPQQIDLNEILEDLAPFLPRILGEDVRIRIDVAAEPSMVFADPIQLQQIVLNLAANARDAMPHGGNLTIASTPAPASEDLPGTRESASRHGEVLLTVADTGIGMSAESKAHLFEPFFTTKDSATHSGLGLATVHGIVRQSGGYVWVRSEPDQGTTVRVYLPYAGPGARPAAPIPGTASSPQGGIESVLLVEDDPAVLALAERVLAMYGYRVKAVSSPALAKAAVLVANTPFDLLVTDVVLPEGSGPELAQDLRRDLPALRVLFISGYPPESHSKALSGVAEERLLQKPFTPVELATQVRCALDHIS